MTGAYMLRGGSFPCEDGGGERWYSKDARPLANSDEDLAELMPFGAYLEPAAVGAGAGGLCIAAG